MEEEMNLSLILKATCLLCGKTLCKKCHNILHSQKTKQLNSYNIDYFNEDNKALIAPLIASVVRAGVEIPPDNL